jgi:hypothetical protein
MSEGPLLLRIDQETTTCDQTDWVAGKVRIRTEALDGRGRKLDIADPEATSYAIGQHTITTTAQRVAGSAAYLLDGSREWSLDDGSLLYPYTHKAEIAGTGWVGYLDARCARRDAAVAVAAGDLELMALLTIAPEHGAQQRFAVLFDAEVHDAHVQKAHPDDPDPDGTRICSPAEISGDASGLRLTFGEGESLTMPFERDGRIDPAKARFEAGERRRLVAVPKPWSELVGR